MALAEKELKKRAKELLEHAQKVCAVVDNWSLAHNSIYGIGAKFGQLFPTIEDRKAYRKLPENKAVQALLDGVRGDSPLGGEPDDGTTKFLLRLPKAVYAALSHEAEQEGVSINQLILTKVSISLGATLAAIG